MFFFMPLPTELNYERPIGDYKQGAPIGAIGRSNQHRFSVST
jgi:hypothetical protein